MRTYIIAEVGPNHNGSLELALKYIDSLANIGVDAVKFQLSNPELAVSLDGFKASYQKSSDEDNDSPIKMAKSHQLSKEDHLILYQECKRKGVDYLCSFFDIESLKFIDNNVDLKYYKIPSGEIFTLDIIGYMANKNKPIILSTGMSSYAEVKIAIDLFNKNFPKDITVLHCISNYPVPSNDVNLSVMLKLKELFGYDVGFSDHTEGIISSITAVAMGARIIEKHVTFDKGMTGPDHKASSTIEEFNELVKSIREIEKLVGIPEKRFSKEEIEIRNVARKSIVAKNEIKEGQVIKEEDLAFRRPGTGLLPIEKGLIIGRKAAKKISPNRVILKEFIKWQ